MEYKGKDAAVPGPNDPRMWRLLLARLHPDAGGDHELFVFASTVKDAVCDEEVPRRTPVSRRSAEPPTLTYLRLWLSMMSPWASSAAPRSGSQR